RMVAGDELEVDAGRLALRNRRRNFRTQRIVEAEQSVELKPALVALALAAEAVCGKTAPDGYYAHPALGQLRVHRERPLAVARGKVAMLEDAFERPLGHDPRRPAGRFAGGVGHGRPYVCHVLADHVEGVVVGEPPARVKRL